MSAEACGCDAEVGWICEVHRAMPTNEERSAWARAVMLTPLPPQPRDVSPVEESLIDTMRHANMLMTQTTELAQRLTALIAERKHIASVLADFYLAPISMSSVQPILTLAEELNLGLKP